MTNEATSQTPLFPFSYLYALSSLILSPGGSLTQWLTAANLGVTSRGSGQRLTMDTRAGPFIRAEGGGEPS